MFNYIVLSYSYNCVNIYKFKNGKGSETKYARWLLKCKCNYFVAESKVMGCRPEAMIISTDDEDKIKRNVYRWFGKKKYKQLCEILDLYQRARDIDDDIDKIFNNLKFENPEEYCELQNILVNQEEYTYERLPEV